MVGWLVGSQACWVRGGKEGKRERKDSNSQRMSDLGMIDIKRSGVRIRERDQARLERLKLLGIR